MTEKSRRTEIMMEKGVCVPMTEARKVYRVRGLFFWQEE